MTNIQEILDARNALNTIASDIVNKIEKLCSGRAPMFIMNGVRGDSSNPYGANYFAIGCWFYKTLQSFEIDASNVPIYTSKLNEIVNKDPKADKNLLSLVQEFDEKHKDYQSSLIKYVNNPEATMHFIINCVKKALHYTYEKKGCQPTELHFLLVKTIDEWKKRMVVVQEFNDFFEALKPLLVEPQYSDKGLETSLETEVFFPHELFEDFSLIDLHQLSIAIQQGFAIPCTIQPLFPTGGMIKRSLSIPFPEYKKTILNLLFIYLSAAFNFQEYYEYGVSSSFNKYRKWSSSFTNDTEKGELLLSNWLKTTFHEPDNQKELISPPHNKLNRWSLFNNVFQDGQDLLREQPDGFSHLSCIKK